MRFPSTLVANAALNAIVSNVGSSHGVRLDGGSTGGTVEAFGDDANVSLKVRGQGTGGVTIGNSSQNVTLAGATVAFSGSTNVSITSAGTLTLSGSTGVVISSPSVVVSTGLAVKGFYSTTYAWTHAAISSGQFGEIVLSTTQVDIMPGDLLWIAAGTVAPIAVAGYRQSSVGTSRVTVVLCVPGSSASSTSSGTLLISWVDLT